MVWNGANDPQEYPEPQDEAWQIRDVLARIIGAFTSGVYCSNCGRPTDDCDCLIGEAREILAPSLRSGAMS